MNTIEAFFPICASRQQIGREIADLARVAAVRIHDPDLLRAAALERKMISRQSPGRCAALVRTMFWRCRRQRLCCRLRRWPMGFRACDVFTSRGMLPDISGVSRGRRAWICPPCRQRRRSRITPLSI